MNRVALWAISAALLGNAHALSISPQPVNSFVNPESFRQATNHHREPCTGAYSDCLANHLIYLQCGAILVEKMALEEGETPQWHAYSMHSGPKVPFVHAGYDILLSFDPSMPANWYSGEEFDPTARTPGDESRESPESNLHLWQFIQQTVDWLDSRDETLVDACELRAFWKEVRSVPAVSPVGDAVAEDPSDSGGVIE